MDINFLDMACSLIASEVLYRNFNEEKLLKININKKWHTTFSQLATDTKITKYYDPLKNENILTPRQSLFC